MTPMSDREFLKVFSMLLAGLVGLTFVLFVLAQMVGALVPKDKVAPRAQAEQQETVADRIQPVGKLLIAGGAGDKIMDAVIPKANAADGKAVYAQTCQVCHAAGVAGAPKLGDKAAWKDRIPQGKDKLYEHAIKGFQGKVGFMPAKGGNMALPDADVKAAVDYMLSQTK